MLYGKKSHGEDRNAGVKCVINQRGGIFELQRDKIMLYGKFGHISE